MKGILAVYRREMGSYFVSPIAYVVVGLFLLIAGYFFYNILAIIMEQSMMAQIQGMRGGGMQQIDVPGQVNRSFFDVISTIVLFLIPMLTMGVYAEERKRGTMELLLTSPITEIQIVVAKYFAALTLFIIMLAPTLIYEVAMARYSEPAVAWKMIWSGYLGVFLVGAALIAIGTFISSLTESQIIAGVVTFGVFLLLWVVDIGVRQSTSTFGSIVQYLSILHHLEDFSRGVIDTTNIVFYVSAILLSLFLTLRTLDSMRWRRA
jgi:ABC-2 type transport system permease protein